MHADDLAAATGISRRKLTNLIHKLEETGVIAQLESGKVEILGGQSVADVVLLATASAADAQ